MNFHSPIVAETAIPMDRLPEASPTKKPALASKTARDVFIPGDPKGRTEKQWRRAKAASEYSKADVKSRAELDAIATKTAGEFPALANLMKAYNTAAFRLDCALTIESELDEAARDKKTKRIVTRADANAISNPIDEIEIQALLRLMRYRAKSVGEVQVLGKYLAKLRERSDWDDVRDGEGNDTITALLDGLSGIDPTRPHPDAGLLALKLTFDEKKAEYDRLNHEWDAGAQVGNALDKAYEAVSRTAKHIAAAKATTLDGLLVKNAVFEWLRPDEDKDDPRYDLGETTDMRLASGVLRDLGRMAGPPPSYPEDHPWVTVRRLSTELSAALARINDGPVMALIKPATEQSPIAWGDLDVFGGMLPLKPVEIEDKGDQLQGDIDALRELVRTISWDLANLCHDHPEKPGERHTELDHVGHMVRVLETVADKLVLDVNEHVTHLYGVADANRGSFDEVQKARRVPPAEDGEGALSSDLNATSSKAA